MTIYEHMRIREASSGDRTLGSLTDTAISKVPFLFPAGSNISSGHCFAKKFKPTNLGSLKKS